MRTNTAIASNSTQDGGGSAELRIDTTISKHMEIQAVERFERLRAQPEARAWLNYLEDIANINVTATMADYVWLYERAPNEWLAGMIWGKLSFRKVLEYLTGRASLDFHPQDQSIAAECYAQLEKIRQDQSAAHWHHYLEDIGDLNSLAERKDFVWLNEYAPNDWAKGFVWGKFSFRAEMSIFSGRPF